MSTELEKFTEAYATMTVAIYEPLILKWVSGWTVYTAADALAWRMQKAKYVNMDLAFATAQALGIGPIRRAPPPDLNNIPPGPPPPNPKAVDLAGYGIKQEDVYPIQVDGYPDAVRIGDKIYLHGVLRVRPTPEEASRPKGLFAWILGSRAAKPAEPQGDPYMGVQTLPTYVNGVMGSIDPDFDFRTVRAQVFNQMINAVRVTVADPDRELAVELAAALRNIGGMPLPNFLPPEQIEEALSPIGIAHFYRQFYFNKEEGVGPIEEAFTIAPLETLEVVYERVRRQIHEELVEVGSETVSEAAVETKNLDEISDKVSSMIQHDASASMSVHASYSTGVWQGSADATANLSTSTQQSREETSRRLKEVTKRASERITKSFSIKTRDIEDVTTTNLTRRVIKNELEHPVSYALRRVLRQVRVKVQDLGPRLVWQLYVQNPGGGLARSRFVNFREAEPISMPGTPPGVPTRPIGGTASGTSESRSLYDQGHRTWYVPLSIHAGTDQKITAVSIDSIAELEGDSKSNYKTVPLNALQWGQVWDESTSTYAVNIGVQPGGGAGLLVTYTCTWEPSQRVLDEWEKERKAAADEYAKQIADAEKRLQEQFERQKQLITERSKIRSRPANDLRREERYEVMNRMISHLFARGDDPSAPAPLEIEYFHRYFDIDGMFTYTHPSWWIPRYTPVATSFGRTAYEITSESEPAPMGSSLGWMIQLDGDTRRNEFLNSPWARVCLPIRPRREREAIKWLAKHIEGEFGYDPNSAPLKDLLEEIEKRRSNEDALGVNGPDYVTVDSTVGAPPDPLKPENVYPIVDEFEVTVPTDGFVYDELKVIT